MNSSEELKNYLAMAYMISAQYDNPPDNPVSKVCGAIDGAPQGTDILGRVAAGLNVSFLGGGSRQHCNYVDDFKPTNKSGWTWQVYIDSNVLIISIKQILIQGKVDHISIYVSDLH